MQELFEAAAAAGADGAATGSAVSPFDSDQQQAADGQHQRQRQRQAAAQPDERPVASESSAIQPELSLAASLPAADGQLDEGEAEVSSDATGNGGGSGNGRGSVHDDLFEFRRRPSAAAKAGQT